ncbi:MAG TPA: NAD(P)H-quinone oxidoreductase [Gammaproteobacteria bacterium]|nr:NAD(P)H-quinone oxidoreductase [Gammaproteobacteria bacterium]
MEAIVLDDFGGPEVMRLGDIERPKPGQDQILIRVAATSVNRSDTLQRRGAYPPPPGESDILGLEAAGTVEEIGANVQGFAVGERVTALLAGGGYAELAAAYAGHVLRMPDSMSFGEAACLCETYITAYLNLFMTAGLQDGETVLLHGGGGGVNIAAIQLCKCLVPRSPIVVTASPAKLERVAELGVDRVVNYRNENFAEAVLDFTKGRGADVILDHIGAAYLERNLKSLAVGGRLSLIGVMGGVEASLNLGRLMVNRQQILGSVLRPRSVEEKAEIVAAFGRAVMPLLAERRIVPVIDRVLPLSEAAEAHRVMEDSAHFGKIVLRVSA